MHSKHLCTALRAACVAAFMTTAGVVLADEGPKLAEIVSKDLSFAIAVPEGFQLEAGDATLAARYDAGETKLQESISLNLLRSARFAAAVGATGNVYVGDLDKTARQKFEQFQQAVARSEAAGQTGSGGVSISVTGGCFSGEPMKALPISTWAQIDTRRGYREIVQNQDLLSMLDEPTRQRLIANLRPCP